MRIRLLVAMKARVKEGGSIIIHPGIYDTESENFPEALRDESRPGVVQFLDNPPAEMPGGSSQEPEDDGLIDPDDEDNSDLPVIEEEEEVEEKMFSEEPVKEEVVEEEEEVVKEVKPKKGGKLKRRT
jgi:hypothetical protein